MRQRGQRPAAQHVRGVAPVRNRGVPPQRHGERGQPLGKVRRAGHERPGQQPPVQRRARDGVGRAEAPAGEDGLHHFEPQRQRLDAGPQRLGRHPRPRHGGKAQDDLGLDPRLGQARQRHGRGAKGLHGRVVDRPPDRGVDAVFVPDRVVGEAELAAHRALAPRLPQGLKPGGRLIGLGQTETRIGRGEGRDRMRPVQRGERRARDGGRVAHPATSSPASEFGAEAVILTRASAPAPRPGAAA
jgi:hypothetical protein